MNARIYLQSAGICIHTHIYISMGIYWYMYIHVFDLRCECGIKFHASGLWMLDSRLSLRTMPGSRRQSYDILKGGVPRVNDTYIYIYILAALNSPCTPKNPWNSPLLEAPPLRILKIEPKSLDPNASSEMKDHLSLMYIWVVVKIRVPFWVP